MALYVGEHNFVFYLMYDCCFGGLFEDISKSILGDMTMRKALVAAAKNMGQLIIWR